MRSGLIAGLVIVAALATASPAAARGFAASGTFPGAGGDVTYQLRACQGRLGTYELTWQHVGGWSGGTTKRWVFTAVGRAVPLSWSYPVSVGGMTLQYTYDGTATLGGSPGAPTVTFNPPTGTILIPVVGSTPYLVGHSGPLQPATAAQCAGFVPAACVVPKLKNKALANAKRALAAGRCKLGTVTKRRSSSVARGRVMSQTPRAGVVKGQWAKVAVVLSRGR